MRLHFDIQWQLQVGNEHVDISSTLLKVLGNIAQGRNLREAASAAEISYRNAWGQIALWEEHFNNQLVISERGRGTTLTPFATALLDTKAEIDASLDVSLEAAAERASGRLTRMMDRDAAAIRIVSSDHPLINDFANQLRDSHQGRVVLDVIGSESALRRYQRPDADIVGFHVPCGATFRALSERMLNWLDEDRDDFYHLEQRSLGLIFNPTLNIRSVEDLLHRDKIKFINRQPGSATRLAFDTILEANAIEPSDIDGYAEQEHTHTAVAARIASGERDVGIAESGVANKFSLGFTPLINENFYIGFKVELQDALKKTIIEHFKALPNLAFKHVSISDMRRNCDFG